MLAISDFQQATVDHLKAAYGGQEVPLGLKEAVRPLRASNAVLTLTSRLAHLVSGGRGHERSTTESSSRSGLGYCSADPRETEPAEPVLHIKDVPWPGRARDLCTSGEARISSGGEENEPEQVFLVTETALSF